MIPRSAMRTFRGCPSLTLLVALVSYILAGGVEPASAFKLYVHERIVRDSLAPFGLSANAMNMIIGSFPSGTGNLGSDRYQSDAYRHFDNAQNPTDICN